MRRGLLREERKVSLHIIVICMIVPLWCESLLALSIEDPLVSLEKKFLDYELRWLPYTLWNYSNKLLNQYCVEPHCLRLVNGCFPEIAL
jgi:hypothetical protein